MKKNVFLTYSESLKNANYNYLMAIQKAYEQKCDAEAEALEQLFNELSETPTYEFPEENIVDIDINNVPEDVNYEDKPFTSRIGTKGTKKSKRFDNFAFGHVTYHSKLSNAKLEADNLKSMGIPCTIYDVRCCQSDKFNVHSHLYVTIDIDTLEKYGKKRSMAIMRGQFTYRIKHGIFNDIPTSGLYEQRVSSKRVKNI